MLKTLVDKLWDAHIVTSIEGIDVLYIDRHYIHEVTSPQAFSGLEKRGLKLFRPEQTTATADHNVPTLNQHMPIKEQLSREQVKKLVENCEKHKIELYGLGHPFQGIVHVIGPELGLTLPGMSIVCGDSHTSTHGAFGCIAFGIGTSEVEQVFATQCLFQKRPKTMKIEVNGNLQQGVMAKDVILYIISRISSGGATGFFVEFTGSTIKNLSMEGRMTICNMSIEMGARGGLITPDETTFSYLKNRRFAPEGKMWDKALAYWKTLYTDAGAEYDVEYTFDASSIEPMITFGTSVDMGIGISQHVPGKTEGEGYEKALAYMDIEAGSSLLGKQVNYVFIGSCTNSRIEDLRVVADFVKGKKKAGNVHAFIVPGSTRVKRQVEAEGLDKILEEAGFEIRDAGCSACLGMNEDKIPAGEYCISTSNRNFEGRQGPGARTILASPLTAATAAIAGCIADPRNF